MGNERMKRFLLHLTSAVAADKQRPIWVREYQLEFPSLMKRKISSIDKHLFFSFSSRFNRFCTKVIGIDVSVNQLAHAIRRENIDYQCRTAEDLAFLSSNSVDLITTATTLHWLEIEMFVEEAKRVLRPYTGTLAVWTYALGTLDNPMADAVYHEFHHILLFPYWNMKRWLADDYYQSLAPLLPYKSTLRQFTIENRAETTLGQFLGFVESLSACQTYRKQNGEQAFQEILENLRQKLIHCYNKTGLKKNHDDIMDYDSMKMTVSSPIRLYVMKKNQA